MPVRAEIPDLKSPFFDLDDQVRIHKIVLRLQRAVADNPAGADLPGAEEFVPHGDYLLPVRQEKTEPTGASASRVRSWAAAGSTAAASSATIRVSVTGSGFLQNDVKRDFRMRWVGAGT